MTAIVDRAARLGRVVHGAEVLPFRGAHLGTCGGGAGGIVGEEGDDDGVCFLDQEAAEFVEPEGFVDAIGGLGEPEGDGAVDRDGVCGAEGVGKEVVEGFKVFC